MKLIDKIREYRAPHPFFTFEFFPPRTDDGFDNLLARIERLSDLIPLAVSITWGAGGSTKERSLELSDVVQNGHGIDTLLHLTCTNMEQGLVDKALRKAKEQGIESILALRGDPPRGAEYWIPTDPRFSHAVDLVKYIKSSEEFANDFCVGVAGYPDGHPDHDVDTELELEHLKAKIDAGADFIVTQLFYDVDRFLEWMSRVRQKGITVPIIPGIMPLQSYASFLRLTKLCGTNVPDAMAKSLEAIRNDDQKVKDFGVGLAIDMIKRLVNEGDIHGVHFCTLNLERSVRLVLEGLQWVGGTPAITNKLIVDQPPPFALDGPAEHLEPESLVINPVDATEAAKTNLAIGPSQPKEKEPSSKSDVNNSSTWDEFTNGRFGDFKSPAFGLQNNQWNAGQGITGAEAIVLWDHPKTEDDLTNLFLAHLHSKISSTPFSPIPLSPESHLILTELEKLTKRGWWTLFSQPAVDAEKSTDEVFGWGPAGGYVFQKAFVEFFASDSDVVELEERIKSKGRGFIEFYAANEKGECKSNAEMGARNAVTWGVFPGQEVAQSTIIEGESFLSWKDEAFNTWGQWALCYAPDSDSRKFLDEVRQKKWLVSVVHHDFKNPTGLWTFLFDD